MATTTRPAERTAPHRSRRRTPATRTARGDMQRLLGAMVATERRRLGLILVACLFCWYVVLPMLLAGSRSGASITSSKQLMNDAMATAEYREGVAALREKRPPNFA